MSFLRSLGRIVLDPANVTGAFSDDPGAPPPQDDGIPSIWQRPGGFIGSLMQPVWNAQDHVNAQRQWDNVAPGPGNKLAGAFDLNAKVKPADWSAQWTYTPGKGPQWIEPKRVSSDNSVPWAAQVNNGPAKTNRF